jgi:protein-tyrosine-phosphatase
MFQRSEVLEYSVKLAGAVQRRLETHRALWSARKSSHACVRQVSPRRVLTLCYGNIYRSPFAAAVMRSQVAGRAIEIRSAGFHPRAGRSTPEDFVNIAGSYDTHLESHLSSLIDVPLVEWADLIVIMDRHNWDALVRLTDRALPKIAWLGAFLEKGPLEISDPYGRTLSEQQVIAGQIYGAAVALGRSLVPVREHSPS